MIKRILNLKNYEVTTNFSYSCPDKKVHFKGFLISCAPPQFSGRKKVQDILSIGQNRRSFSEATEDLDRIRLMFKDNWVEFDASVQKTGCTWVAVRHHAQYK